MIGTHPQGGITYHCVATVVALHTLPELRGSEVLSEVNELLVAVVVVTK